MIKRCVLFTFKKESFKHHSYPPASRRMPKSVKDPLRRGSYLRSYRYYTSMISFLCFCDFVNFCNIFICFFWISSVYPLKSSSVISPAFSSFLRSSFPSRRTLRTATFASSAYFSQLLQDHDDALLLVQGMQYELQFHH